MYTIHFKYLRGFNFIKTRYKKKNNIKIMKINIKNLKIN